MSSDELKKIIVQFNDKTFEIMRTLKEKIIVFRSKNMNPKQMLDDKSTAPRFGARLCFCPKRRRGAVVSEA